MHCIPQQGGGSRQVGTGRKANDGDLIRRNAQIRRIPAQVQEGGRGFGQRLDVYKRQVPCRQPQPSGCGRSFQVSGSYPQAHRHGPDPGKR